MTSKVLDMSSLSLVLASTLVFAPPASSRGFQGEPSGPPDLRETRAPTPTRSGDVIAPQRFGPGPLHKVWLQGEKRSEHQARLAASGGLVRMHEYGGFALAIVDERAFASSAELRAGDYDFRDEQDLMVFNELLLDGRQPERTLANLPRSLRASLPGASALPAEAGLYLVQLEGPSRDEWVSSLDALGLTFRQFVPMNAFVVDLPPERVVDLTALAQASPWIQHAGVYEPAFKLHAELRQAYLRAEGAARRVTIQLVSGPRSAAALAEIRRVADEVLDVQIVGPYLNVQARLQPAFFQPLSFSPAVFQIEPLGERRRFDERQGQIVAGNTTATGPSAPGYLAWLAAEGFDASQFGSFAVNVADDAMSLTGHPDLPSSRVAFTLNPTNQTGMEGGHGFLNANILAGFNDGTGSALEDGGGYNYGLGIAPFAHVGSTAIFGQGTIDPTTYESEAYGLGARISSNSWGYQTLMGDPVADYDASSQQYDFITRDAQSGTTGNQEYLVVFSAGNYGSGSNTVSTPGTAKNIVTVAAGENARQTGTDGCGIANSGANNWNDIASSSSRGPVDSSGGDGRWKPEISAPGTHVQAGIPQSNYGGSSLCNPFWPTGQTLYSWSSGTSQACPAVAGGAALVHQWFLNHGLGAPSPAMTKAMLVVGGQYMTGTGANDTLPSNIQGSGILHLPRVLGSASRILTDQTQVLAGSGATYQVTGNVVDTAKPFRVALVWTDSPGPTSGAPYVNNLDLTVSLGASTYLGNVFTGANSVTGGAADIRNNTELVFLPAGTSGPFTITVTGTAIGGDGIPGDADTTDQDFALVVYNGAVPPPPPVADFTGTPTSGTAPLAVDFTDSSTGSITSWSWSFGDGGTSTAQHPSHTYTGMGIYTVALTVTGPGGSDTLTSTNYVTVTGGGGVLHYISFAADTAVPGVGTVADEDVVTFDPSSGSWAIYFDGSDVGLDGTDVSGLHVRADGSILMSFDSPTFSVPGLVGGPSGTTVENHDVVLFTPTSTGTTTAGTFTFYLDGSDVMLTAVGESIDGLFEFPNGSLGISTTGDPTIAPMVGLADEDIVRFTGTSFGAATAGAWSYYFDGSDVGFGDTSEDLDAIAFASATETVFSTVGSYSAAGSSGEGADASVFTGSYGPATSGSAALLLDLSTLGIEATANIDGLSRLP